MVDDYDSNAISSIINLHCVENSGKYRAFFIVVLKYRAFGFNNIFNRVDEYATFMLFKIGNISMGDSLVDGIYLPHWDVFKKYYKKNYAIKEI